MMIQKLKDDLKAAMLAKDELRKNILRVVLGELQLIEARNQQVNDEKVCGVIKKLIASNEETLAAGGAQKLAEENKILATYLPSYWSVVEIEAFFLNREGPEFEQIRDAKSAGQATGIAMKTLKTVGAPVQGVDVTAFVEKVRA